VRLKKNFFPALGTFLLFLEDLLVSLAASTTAELDNNIVM